MRTIVYHNVYKMAVLDEDETIELNLTTPMREGCVFGTVTCKVFELDSIMEYVMNTETFKTEPMVIGYNGDWKIFFIREKQRH